jgi:hypothetical protein
MDNEKKPLLFPTGPAPPRTKSKDKLKGNNRYTFWILAAVIVTAVIVVIFVRSPSSADSNSTDRYTCGPHTELIGNQCVGEDTTTAVNEKLAAIADKAAAEAARDAAIADKEAAETAKLAAIADKEAAETAKEAALAVIDVAIADKEAAIAQSLTVLNDQETAETAKEAAEAARDAAIAEKEAAKRSAAASEAAKSAALITKAAAEDARDAAHAAKDAAEAARDECLEGQSAGQCDITLTDEGTCQSNGEVILTYTLNARNGAKCADPKYGFTVLGDDGVNPQDGQTPSDGDSISVYVPCGCIFKDEPWGQNCMNFENIPYHPCKQKSPGDDCLFCAPDDSECAETMVVKTCQDAGSSKLVCSPLI